MQERLCGDPGRAMRDHVGEVPAYQHACHAFPFRRDYSRGLGEHIIHLRALFAPSHMIPLPGQQTAIEDMISTVYERTAVLSFTLDIVYEISDSLNDYARLFQETRQGPRLPASILPEQGKFEELARRIESFCGDGRTSCYVKVGITVAVGGAQCELLSAVYVTQPPGRRLRRGTISFRNNAHFSASSGIDADGPSVYEPLVMFHLDRIAHEELKSLIIQVDEERAFLRGRHEHEDDDEDQVDHRDDDGA